MLLLHAMMSKSSLNDVWNDAKEVNYGNAVLNISLRITSWGWVCSSLHARVTPRKSFWSLGSLNASLILFSKSFHTKLCTLLSVLFYIKVEEMVESWYLILSIFGNLISKVSIIMYCPFFSVSSFVNFVSVFRHHDCGLDPHGLPDTLPHQLAHVQGVCNGVEAC